MEDSTHFLLGVPGAVPGVIPGVVPGAVPGGIYYPGNAHETSTLPGKVDSECTHDRCTF